MRDDPTAAPRRRPFRLPGSVHRAIAVLVVVAAAADAGAQEEPTQGRGELVTDRPDVTESASIVAPGLVQVETGLVFEDPDVGAASLTVPGTLARIGVARPLEARAGWAGWTDVEEGGAGAGDPELGVKLGWPVANSGADLALLVSATLPLGEEPFGATAVVPEAKVIGAFDLTSNVGLTANAGAALPEAETEDHRDVLASWSSSLGIDLTGRLGSFLEYAGEKLGADASDHALHAGVAFLVSPDVQLDASGGAVVSGQERWFAGAGVSVRFDP